MKKKILTITLVSGDEIKRDVTDTWTSPTKFGAPANDYHYAAKCQSICFNGYTDFEKVSPTNYTHIAPSQIKSVSLTFVEENEEA